MIPEYAHFSLIIGLWLSILLAVLPTLGVLTGQQRLIRSGQSLAVGQFIFILIAFVGLAYAFAIDDFTLKVVAQNSNLNLPMQYKIAATWGNHEGSILLWILVLAMWTLAVAVFSKRLPAELLAQVLSTMGLISIGFILFSLLTSNAFERTFPNIPSDGRDLNPLLQDFGMIIHPPMLYIGYAGFSVPFAFAIAALGSGQLDAAWARWSRPWTNIAWAFLTVGIALGSWWAYYELGWGGWWFWDPVENASFMPWLVGTALLHSLAVTEKRGVFKSWTVLLAIFAFSLSLLGTFLVRSGVITSVHAFASDPDRGLFILIFLSIVIGCSLFLYALRVPTVRSSITFAYLSREFFLLINNVIFVLAMLTILLGTLFPLIMDALGQGRYSVGPPYFNALFVPMMAVMFALMGFGPQARWKATSARQLFKPMLSAAISALVIGLLAPLIFGQWLNDGGYNFWVAIGVVLGMWIIAGSVVHLRASLYSKKTGQMLWSRLRPALAGMLLAHIGMAVTMLGVVLTSHYSSEEDVLLRPGETRDVGSLANMSIRFKEQGISQGPNYIADYGEFELLKKGKVVAVLRPEKRSYPTQQNVMTEAAIDAGFWRDIYVALGDKVDNQAWAVRIQYKAFVRWIWLGALLMAAGGVLAILDPRYRRAIVTKSTAATDKTRASTAALSSDVAVVQQSQPQA